MEGLKYIEGYLLELAAAQKDQADKGNNYSAGAASAYVTAADILSNYIEQMEGQ